MTRRALPLLLLAVALLTSGCGGGDAGAASSNASATPSASVSLPSGATLTKGGSDLAFGATATVGFAPNEKKATALTLEVTKVVKGRISDLSAYQLDAATKSATPYYATVSVANIGAGDIGRTRIPLWGLSSDDTLIGSSGFTNAFGTCPSRPLPDSFGQGDDLTTCLMYLVPQGATLAGISYRPLTSDDPIVWKGTVTSESAKPSKKKSTSGS